MDGGEACAGWHPSPHTSPSLCRTRARPALRHGDAHPGEHAARRLGDDGRRPHVRRHRAHRRTAQKAVAIVRKARDEIFALDSSAPDFSDKVRAIVERRNAALLARLTNDADRARATLLRRTLGVRITDPREFSGSPDAALDERTLAKQDSVAAHLDALPSDVDGWKSRAYAALLADADAAHDFPRVERRARRFIDVTPVDARRRRTGHAS
jgi:hypothetical protein